VGDGSREPLARKSRPQVKRFEVAGVKEVTKKVADVDGGRTRRRDLGLGHLISPLKGLNWNGRRNSENVLGTKEEETSWGGRAKGRNPRVGTSQLERVKKKEKQGTNQPETTG